MAIVFSMREALDTRRNWLSKDMVIIFAENIFKDYYTAWDKVGLRMEIFAAYVGSIALLSGPAAHQAWLRNSWGKAFRMVSSAIDPTYAAKTSMQWATFSHAMSSP